MDKLLNLIGLAQKAGRLAVGEEPTGAAARARDARLILVAADAAENSVRRVRHFADAGQCLWCRIGADKDALGRAVGRSSCAMLAVTDIGFAEAIARKLAEGDERFAETAEKLAVKAQRAAERRREAEAHEKNVRTGKKRPAKKTAEAGRSGAEAGRKASRAAVCRGSGRKAPDRRAEPRRREEAEPRGA
ncbi:MAG: L7Ae/L30e/S12e/Gadd45 family ribosomal protein [Oscillospiraceae bacterium]